MSSAKAKLLVVRRVSVQHDLDDAVLVRSKIPVAQFVFPVMVSLGRCVVVVDFGSDKLSLRSFISTRLQHRTSWSSSSTVKFGFTPVKLVTISYACCPRLPQVWQKRWCSLGSISRRFQALTSIVSTKVHPLLWLFSAKDSLAWLKASS